MKIKKNLSWVATMSAFAICSSIGNAQIQYTNSLAGATLIYSNAFDGAAVNITNTPADYEAGILGGKSNTNWIDALGANNTNALYANGVMGTAQGDAWLLPFSPLAGYVYTLNASVNFTGNPGTWVGAGFCNYFGVIGGSNDRFNTGGVDIGILTESSRNVQAFGGPGATLGYANVNAIWTPATGIHTLTLILDTTGTKWVIASFVDHVQASTNYTYASNPSILGLGLSQNGSAAALAQNTFTWNALTLAASPLVITKQPVSASVAAGVAFTNTVIVSAMAPSYQWYNNNVAVQGATNASIIFNPVTVGNAGNYYVVITNSLGGSATSAPVSLTVYSAPTISAAYPVAYTNLLTLYGGNPGSSPRFSVSVIGQQPLYYQWLTNGVAVGGATNTSFTFTNCPLDGPTSFACVITNAGGAVSNTWQASYVAAPTAAFPETELSYNPVGFWRLNEGSDDGNGDIGTLALDYASDNNGIYTNAVFGYPGYSTTDPTESAVRFNYAGAPSGVFAIQGIDFSTNANATFSVQAWVQGPVGQPSGAGLISKGYNGGEQFALDINGNKYRFIVRDAGGNAYSVTAPTGPDGNWHFIVGVCDEINGTVSLYVDGLLATGTTPISSGAGLLATTQQVTIGARGSVAGLDDDLQFSGYLSDLAAFNYALSPGQVGTLYTAAGYSLGFTFVPPLPPTNVVFLANTTLTISATVFGAPPIGYYWTNVTTGGILASGSTNVLGNLNATLTIPNAPASLSGDELELVVTNAANSTNSFTTLFSPPPPVTLDYSSPILYSNFFNGGTYSIAGMPLTAANSLVGGTNAAWTDALGVNDTGSLEASGVDATTLGDSWVLPFTPHAGYVYTLTGSVTFTGNPGNWVGLGFAQRVPTNAAVGYGRFSDGGAAPPDQGPNGYDWLIMTEGTGNVQYFSGAGGTGPVTAANGFFTAGVGTNTAMVVLDTTGAKWVMDAYVDGMPTATNTYASNPPIGAVGITQTTLATPGTVQWNYLSLSQVAPGGVPPYLLNPLPPTNSIVLTNETITISATAFGSAPLGYYWSNNSTIIASGATNDMAPLPADLSVPSSSLSAGPLELVVTNAYGTNITLITLVSPINTTPGSILFSAMGNQLTLDWPTNLGWTLQVQTNSLGAGLSTNWVDVPGSTTITNVVVPISSTNGSVFYRLRY
jgi:hypothetical protein